jgi:hypothetical protein
MNKYYFTCTQVFTSIARYLINACPLSACQSSCWWKVLILIYCVRLSSCVCVRVSCSYACSRYSDEYSILIESNDDDTAAECVCRRRDCILFKFSFALFLNLMKLKLKNNKKRKAEGIND